MSTVTDDLVTEPEFPLERDFDQLTPAEQEVVVNFHEPQRRRGMAKQYLQQTDWYVVRQTETGTAIPDNVLALRVQARIDGSEE
tara:strand:+ start:804 stop:1055 length:252 start_codon:yes stop_codon:yes gene_type:complete